MERLPKVTSKKRKIVGRGMGSGKGSHTTGRGQKGQRSRGKIHILFEGVKMKKSLLKRLPLQRGKGKFHPKGKPIIINLNYLTLLKDGATVDIDLLVKEGLVKADDAKTFGVKILGSGKEFKKKLIIKVPTSHSVAKVIEKAGGKVESSK